MKHDRELGRPRGATASIALIALMAAHGCSADAGTALPTWLVGCWVSEDSSSLEAWTQDSETTLIGFSSVVNDNKVVFYELMSLRLDDGKLVFTAYPSNQPGGSFPMESQQKDSVTFLNDKHDYPQRIHYRRDGDRLLADIARADGEQRVDFIKARCE